MSRISLGYYLIAALMIWGIPAVIVTGPQAILYTIVASVPIWLICRRKLTLAALSRRQISVATCAVLASFSLAYVFCDALFGQQLLQMNMFLHHEAALDRVVDQLNQNMSKGGGIAVLLGQILSLLPFALIDSTRDTSRYGRWLLWTIALIVMFYQITTGRGPVLMAVMAILLGRTSNWRRFIVAGSLALGVFLLASSFRGETDAQSSVLSAVMFPFINLGLLLNAHCGSAPWYGFLAEFLKKFMPGFLIPKTIFSFNMEMSLCIYPSINNTVDSVSVFTWLGEIFYYKPSILTALLAGGILGVLARILDRLFLRNQMYSSRVFAGLLYIAYCRSRTQDVFTLLIAQLIFLVFFWPLLSGLTRNLRSLLIKEGPAEINSAPGQGLP